MSKLNIAIIGLGTVGQGLVQLIQENSQKYKLSTGVEINIVAVSAGSKDKRRDVDISKYEWLDSPLDATKIPELGIVVELVGGDSGIALDLAKETLSTGIDFVTANKALVAKHGSELAKLADENNSQLMYEASVAGGIPIIKAVKEAVAANIIHRVTGILNGTCNYILSLMENGKTPFDVALKKAQDLGYAEADPSFDIDGVDAAHKTVILNAASYGLVPDFSQISIEGIRGIDSADIKYAADLGYKIRLVGEASKNDDGSYSQAVYKCLFAFNHPLAAISGATNAVSIDSQPLGATTYIGQGAGRGPTASAVMADILDLARGFKSFAFAVPANALKPGNYKDTNRAMSKFYVRIKASEGAGVLAKITEQLSNQDISIDVLHQPEHGDKADVIMITNTVEKQNLDQAINAIENLREVVDKAVVIRVN